MIPRYKVFGVKSGEDDLLIEIETNAPRKVAILVHMHTVAGYHARVWDTRKRKFKDQQVINRLVSYLNRGERHA